MSIEWTSLERHGFPSFSGGKCQQSLPEMDGWMGRWVDRWVDGWINGRKERKEGIGIGIRREGYISVGSSC